MGIYFEKINNLPIGLTSLFKFLNFLLISSASEYLSNPPNKSIFSFPQVYKV